MSSAPAAAATAVSGIKHPEESVLEHMTSARAIWLGQQLKGPPSSKPQPDPPYRPHEAAQQTGLLPVPGEAPRDSFGGLYGVTRGVPSCGTTLQPVLLPTRPERHQETANTPRRKIANTPYLSYLILIAIA